MWRVNRGCQSIWLRYKITPTWFVEMYWYWCAPAWPVVDIDYGFLCFWPKPKPKTSPKHFIQPRVVVSFESAIHHNDARPISTLVKPVGFRLLMSSTTNEGSAQSQNSQSKQAQYQKNSAAFFIACLTLVKRRPTAVTSRHKGHAVYPMCSICMS